MCDVQADMCEPICASRCASQARHGCFAALCAVAARVLPRSPPPTHMRSQSESVVVSHSLPSADRACRRHSQAPLFCVRTPGPACQASVVAGLEQVLQDGCVGSYVGCRRMSMLPPDRRPRASQQHTAHSAHETCELRLRCAMRCADGGHLTHLMRCTLGVQWL